MILKIIAEAEQKLSRTSSTLPCDMTNKIKVLGFDFAKKSFTFYIRFHWIRLFGVNVRVGIAA